MPRDDGPRSLGESLRLLASRYRKVDLLVIDTIRERWSDAVGDVLASTCRPEVVREGVLFVRVPNGAYAERLRRSEGDILATYQDLGIRAPTALRVVVGEAPPRPV